MHSFVRASRADGRLADRHFQRRDERLHEVELPDRADVLAERRVAEKAVDDECRHEVADRDPGREPRAVPQRERLVAPEEERDEPDREPFAAQPARPRPAGGQPAPGERARQRERARHAEEVAGHQQPENQQAAPMNPRQHAGQIHRPTCGPRRPSKITTAASSEHHRLQHRPRMPPAQEAAERRHAQQIEPSRPVRRLRFSERRRSAPPFRSRSRSRASATRQSRTAAPRNAIDPGTHISTPAAA